MNPWQQFVRNWTRPSIQQPRRIRQAVDKLFYPVKAVVTFGKNYWDTWHQVYKPEMKDDSK